MQKEFVKITSELYAIKQTGKNTRILMKTTPRA